MASLDHGGLSAFASISAASLASLAGSQICVLVDTFKKDRPTFCQSFAVHVIKYVFDQSIGHSMVVASAPKMSITE